MKEEYDYSNYRVYTYDGITVKYIPLPEFELQSCVNHKRTKRQYNERRNKRTKS